MSGPPTISGIRKLPKPPIKAGITMKKIINKACAVTILLYNWLSDIYCTPGPLNSIRINTENAVPNNPENRANIKYKVPISLAFVEKNQRSFQIVMVDIKFLLLVLLVPLVLLVLGIFWVWEWGCIVKEF
jgi:hypothetical protein